MRHDRRLYTGWDESDDPSERMMLDEHGQPIERRFNAGRLAERAIDELIGLCRGLVADGVLTQSEAEFLRNWLDESRGAREAWPRDILFARVSEMLSDGVLDEGEQAELMGTLRDLTGETESSLGAPAHPAEVALTRPPPAVEFEDRRFYFTGRFIHGTRRECEVAVRAMGGIVVSGVSGRLDYLVIGSLPSEEWMHASFGRKIEKAIELNRGKATIALVSEDHWVGALVEQQRAKRAEFHRWEERGEFAVAVVGEAFRQGALARYAEAHGIASSGADYLCEARLIPEQYNPHDEHAVAVCLGVEQVGYLSREDARAFRERLALHPFGGAETRCAAKVVTGPEKRGGGGRFGVLLDIEPFPSAGPPLGATVED